ncbi:hypothetical protein HY634_01150 [Candidatus Uhrbacteria bacterium]|nr:hypothetical protein [Candidatus Uhrbacteria bacterium]
MAMSRRQVVGVLVVATVVIIIAIAGARWAGKRTADPSDASRASQTGSAPLPGDHPAVPQNVELQRACDDLASSAPADIVKRWVAAHRATRNALEREVWIRDRFAWMELHKVETTLATCGIRGPHAVEIIAAIAKDEDYGRFVREEREAICASSQKFATATSGFVAWREDASVLWNAACVRLLSGSVAGTTPSAPIEGSAAPPASEPPTPAATCATELGSNRAGMADRALEPEGWIAYGRALAACGPDTNPWGALKLERGRDEFVDDYVVPFINGDVLQGSPFQKQAADLHGRIVTAWGLSD